MGRVSCFSIRLSGGLVMGLLTFFGFCVFFVIGVLVGVAVENNHQQQKRREDSIRYWRWANNIENIETQMVQDGWKL